MIDLISRKALPNTVLVGGKAFSVYTDFSIWMRFVNAYEKWDKKGELDISYLFKNELPVFHSIEDYAPVFEFAYPKNQIPRGEPSSERILDYEIDSDYIYAAFYQQYGIDLLEIKELHWHKFKALLNGLCEETRLYEIMGHRSYTGEKIKSQEEIYRRLKEAWSLPEIETEEQKEVEDRFDDFFG